jgi:peptidoglycan/LPS O-acetylase OafA/YrhL
MNIKKQRLIKVSMGPGLFRFLLSSVVVVVHYSSLSFGGAAVYLFFALSGYWVSKMWEAKYSQLPRPYATFLISRAWRLAPVFLFCSMLALMVAVVLPSLIPAAKPPAVLSTQMLISSFVLLGYHTAQHGPLGPAWSLDMEMQFYILVPMILVALRNRPRMIATLLVVLGCASSVIYGDELVTAYLPMFLIGMLAAQYPEFLRGEQKAISSALLVFLILCFFTITPKLRPVLFGGANPGDLFVFNRLLNVVIALAAMPFALNTVFHKSDAFDKLLSDMSYSVYLFHWIPILVVTYYVPWLAKQPFSLRATVSAVIIAFTYAAALAITIWIDRPSSKARLRLVQGSRIPALST